jgi:uncharacterized protein YndB with AHSA1/START domain
MILTNETMFTKHPSGSKLLITRDINAPLDKVWRAWTEAELLDKWWGPKPWRAETKTMDFRDGGLWLYAMVSPEGEKHWCRVDFHTVLPPHGFTSTATFCDAEGNRTAGLPAMHWDNKFSAEDGTTHVYIELSFDSAADLEQIVQMGFKEGFTMGLSNLDALLA